MKNIFNYYVAILLPILGLLGLIHYDKKIEFLIGLLMYFIYRNFIDGIRLYQLGLIQKSDIWKTNLFFYQIKYFKSLYFKK